MRARRVISMVALTAAQPIVWTVAASTHARKMSEPSVLSATALSNLQGDATQAPESGDSLFRIFEFVLSFVGEISQSFERGDYTGAVIRLLIIVEVLIGALGFAACVTVWGKGKADLVYRIVDVMGALFLIIALLLVAMALL